MSIRRPPPSPAHECAAQDLSPVRSGTRGTWFASVTRLEAEAVGFLQSAASDGSAELSFGDLFEMHYSWLREPVLADLAQFAQSGARPGLLQRLQTLAGDQQERDVVDELLIEFVCSDPALGLAA